MSTTAPSPFDGVIAAHDLVEQALAAPPVGKLVSLKVARHVLCYWGDERLGQDGGDFVTRLIRLLMIADESNSAKIAAADPEWAEYEPAVHALYKTSWGPDWLRGIVEKALAEVAS